MLQDKITEIHGIDFNSLCGPWLVTRKLMAVRKNIVFNLRFMPHLYGLTKGLTCEGISKLFNFCYSGNIPAKVPVELDTKFINSQIIEEWGLTLEQVINDENIKNFIIYDICHYPIIYGLTKRPSDDLIKEAFKVEAVVFKRLGHLSAEEAEKRIIAGIRDKYGIEISELYGYRPEKRDIRMEILRDLKFHPMRYGLPIQPERRFVANLFKCPGTGQQIKEPDDVIYPTKELINQKLMERFGMPLELVKTIPHLRNYVMLEMLYEPFRWGISRKPVLKVLGNIFEYPGFSDAVYKAASRKNVRTAPKSRVKVRED